MKKKILYISMHPAPYRDPVIEKLDEFHELTVLSLFDIPSSHTEWNKSEQLPYNNIYLGKGVNVSCFGKLQLDIIRYLREFRGDLMIVPGYVPLTCLCAILYAKIYKIPYIYAADTVDLPLDKTRKPKLNMVAKWCIKNSKALWVTGLAGRKTFEKTGYDGKYIAEGYYTLDSFKLRDRYQCITAQQKCEWRNDYCIKETEKLFLFVGKLIPSRDVGRMLHIVKTARKLHPNIKLMIIGDGPEKYIVDQMIKECPWIINIPRVPYEELCKFYAIADCYLYVGSEPYSLALVEAVIADLPVISSDTVGAAYDYIINGVNGYMNNKSDDDFVSAIGSVLDNEIDRVRLEQCNDQLVEKHCVKAACADLNKIIHMIL